MIKSQLRKGTTTLTETVFRVEPYFHLARFYLSPPDAHIYCILLFCFGKHCRRPDPILEEINGSLIRAIEIHEGNFKR